MKKKELRKEFLEVNEVELFDWFYSKIKENNEKHNALKQSHQELMDRCIAKDEKIQSMYDEIDKAVRLYKESQSKLKAADEVIDIFNNYIEDEETGSLHINLTKAIEHYKSLK